MYEVRFTRYDLRGTIYEVRGTIYEVRGTRYEVRRHLNALYILYILPLLVFLKHDFPGIQIKCAEVPSSGVLGVNAAGVDVEVLVGR